MIPIPSKLVVAGVATLALGLIITLGYRHYTGMQARIVELEASNSALQVALEVEQATSAAKDDALLEWQIAAEEARIEAEHQAAVARQATAETRRLNAIFAEHDLTRLALAKPGLIERRINSGTADIFRMLECASRGGCEPDGGDTPTD